MADISKVKALNGTTYNLKDGRIPNLPNNTTTYLRGDGTWATPSVSEITSAADVSDEGDYLLITPSEGGGSSPNLQEKTNINPTELSQTIVADTGYDGLSSVQINAISSSYVGSGITRRSSSDLTASGSTITVPSGYYASQESKSVSSGSEGIPTATKGTVSNHSVDITPSVTNTAGYISGGTKSGTAITVTASELESGSLSISENGVHDVSGYSSVNVDVEVPSTTWQTMYDGNITIVTDNPNYFVINDYTTPLSSNETYRVTWGTGGTQYVCETIADGNGTAYDGYIFGNLGLIGGTDTGEPFLIYRDRNNRIAAVTDQSAGTVHIIIGKQVASGGSVLVSKTITANGTYDPANDNANGYSEVIVNVPSGGKAGQIQSKVARTSSTTYTDMGFEITVAKAGTYNIYWSGYRSSTSGTSGAQIYKNDASLGNAVTTFDSTYTNCQTGVLSNQTLAADDVITIRARARNTSSYMYIYNLAIIEA